MHKGNVTNNFQNTNLSDNTTGVKFDNCQIDKNINQFTLTFPKLQCIFGQPKYDSQKLIQNGAHTLLYFFIVSVVMFLILISTFPTNFETFKDLEPGFIKILISAIALIVAVTCFFEVSYRKQKINLTSKSRSIIKRGFNLYLILFFFITGLYAFTGFYKLALLSFMVFVYLLIVMLLTKKLFLPTSTGDQSRVFAKQKKL